MGILGMTVSGSRIWNDWVVEWLKKFGDEVVYRDEIPSGTMDVSSWCMKIVNANPDAVYSGAIHVQMQLPLTLEKMGYTKDFMMVDSITEADVAKIGSQLAGKGENLLWVSRYISPLENVPELDKIRMAIKKYGSTYSICARHCAGWVMGIIIEEALKKTGYPCTRENLLTALEKTNVDTRGLTGGPIIFTSKDHHGPSWFKVYRWNANRQGSMPVKDWFKVETEGVAKK